MEKKTARCPECAQQVFVQPLHTATTVSLRLVPHSNPDGALCSGTFRSVATIRRPPPHTKEPPVEH